MVLANGKTIEPTGKAYRILMATIGHWNKEGIMFEEFLFWGQRGVHEANWTRPVRSSRAASARRRGGSPIDALP
jgi:hypothetical protein